MKFFSLLFKMRVSARSITLALALKMDVSLSRVCFRAFLFNITANPVLLLSFE